MTKSEALAEMPLKRAEGYLVHPMLLAIYADDEELPEGFVEMLWHKPEPKQIILYTAPKIQAQINAALEEYITDFKKP